MLRWWYGSALYRGYGRLADRLYDWWHPPSKEPESRRSYGYGYGPRQRSRAARWRRAIRRRIRESGPVRWWNQAWVSWSNTFYEWWYPRVGESEEQRGYGYGYGRARASRLRLALASLRHWWRRTPPGRAWERVSLALWEWWYPEVEMAGSGYGYGYGYGPRRVSRLSLVLGRVRRRWRHSWLGQKWRSFSLAAWEWWYPEPDAPSNSGRSYGYGYGGARRVSRPVRFLKRAMRWFRGTWLGRKLRWLLDDLERYVGQASNWLVYAFASGRFQRWLFRWQTGVLILCVGAGLWCAYAYGLPRYRVLLERQYAQQADLWLKKGDRSRAMLRARQTLSLNASNAIATRVFGDVADFYSSPFAMYWRQRAVILSPSVTNRLSLASTALRYEQFPFPTATKALGEITPEARETPSYHLIAATMAVRMNNLEEAERHYLEALKFAPNDPAAKMSLAVIRLRSKDPVLVKDSRTTLELLRADRGVGLLALRSLVAESVDRGELERAETLSWQLHTNAQSTFSDRILHLAILKAVRSSAFDKFLAETQAKAGSNPMAIGELASWMNTSGYARQGLAWLEGLPRDVVRQGFLPISLADAYAAIGAWKDLEKYLLSEPWPGLDHVRFAMLALATRKEDGTPQSFAWEQAIRVASASPNALSMLAELAGSWGWTAEAEQTLWHAADRFSKQGWALQALDRFYTQRRDTAGLRRVYAERMQQNTENRLARNNYAMVSLLLNADRPNAHKIAEELHVAEPENVVFTSTFAFSLHLRGRTKEAIEALRALGLEKLDDPAVALYYGAFLAADGQTETSRTYLKRAAGAFMLPEEKELLARASQQSGQPL